MGHYAAWPPHPTAHVCPAPPPHTRLLLLLLQSHPHVPVVESLSDLWQVQALKEEREAATRRGARLQALAAARQAAEEQSHAQA